jgi:hypothetical protein
MKDTVIYKAAILYDDCSGIEVGVEFDPCRLPSLLGNFVTIKTGSTYIDIRTNHIPRLIEWLQDAQNAEVSYLARAIGNEGNQ